MEQSTKVMEWVAYGLIGAFTGFTCACMTSIEEHIHIYRRDTADSWINGSEENLMKGWFVFTGLAIILTLLGSAMTVYYGPGAKGSGVAELIGYLNGVNLPDVFSFETFFTKIFGTILAVTGGLCIGKEGPLAHIGASIGVIVPYFPIPRFKYFHNDKHKRNFIAAGTSAGVSAAFGAPVGGALFAYEISKPNSFWTFSIVWRSFFASTFCMFTLTYTTKMIKWDENMATISTDALKFGKTVVKSPEWTMIPMAVFLGVVCGVLGAAIVYINAKVAMCRKVCIKRGSLKVAEAVLFSLITTTAFFWLPHYFMECKSTDAETLKPEY